MRGVVGGQLGGQVSGRVGCQVVGRGVGQVRGLVADLVGGGVVGECSCVLLSTGKQSDFFGHAALEATHTRLKWLQQTHDHTSSTCT